MIRRLHEGDRARLVALLDTAPHLNMYLLGNVDAYGFDADFCEFFGDVDGSRIAGVVNRYFSGWTVFGAADADWTGLGALVDNHGTVADRLQDNPGGVTSFLPYLQRYVATTVTEDHLMELPPGGLRPQAAPEGFEVRRATIDDFGRLVELFADADDMTRTPAAVERPLRDRRIWLAIKDGRAVAAALTNAETATSGMIGGVYTVPEWRGYGLSQAVCSGLCEELIASGRQPVLYWHDPAAGHVYTKLGFRQIGTWRSVRLARVLHSRP